MTQPAKSQEPSMEEILASIRRIIADDDASKSTQKPAEAAPAAPPVRPEPSPPPPNPAPRIPDPNLSANPEPAEPEDGAAGEQSADILDLTESMASPMSPPQPSEPHPMPAPAFRTIDGSFDVSYEEQAEKPAPAATSQRAALATAVRRNQRGGGFGLQYAGANRAGAKCPHA